jgi:alpha-pyrone synthase
MDLPSEALSASRAVLADCGNMSSATVLFVIERLWRSGANGPGLALAFGPGLAAEAIHLDFVA